MGYFPVFLQNLKLCGTTLTTVLKRSKRESLGRPLSTSKKNRKTPSYWNIHPAAMETSDWLTIDKYKVCPWATSGVESCITVVGEGFSIAFDMGYPYPAAVKCNHVFISHGHMDHVGAVVMHASKRGLYGMPPATYYIPPHLETPLKSVLEQFSKMNGDKIHAKLRPISVDELVQFQSGLQVKPFPTKHRVPSQGYIIYRHTKKLKPEHQGKSSDVISSLVKQKEDIFNFETVPEIAYTGDTMSDIFDSPHNADLLKVKLLITESTYIDDENIGKNTVQKARERGHMHLDEIIEREQLFADVGNLLLVHFSDKYSTRFVRQEVARKLPQTMSDKIHLGLVLKEKFEFRK